MNEENLYAEFMDALQDQMGHFNESESSNLKKVENESDALGLALDVLGFIPVVGEVTDLINTVRYIRKGNYFFAALSLISLLPVVGDIIGKGTKFASIRKHKNKIQAAAMAARLIKTKVEENQDLIDNFLDRVEGSTNKFVEKHISPNIGQIRSQLMDPDPKNFLPEGHSIDALVESWDLSPKVKSPEEIITESENEPTDPDLWSRAIRAAKDKYDVYPSAYANAFASKWYKEKGGDWKKKSKNEMSEDSVHKDSGLGKWFGEKWVDVSRKEGGKHPECGDSSDSGSRGKDGKRAYPKCVPKSKAKKMSKKEKESATRRKRDKGKPKGGKPQNVSTDKNESINEIFKSWDLSLIEGSKKDDKDKKRKQAKDPVFGIAMTWPGSDFGFGYDDQEKEDADFVPDSGGIAVNFGDTGSEGIFNPGQMGTATVGGE